MTKSSGMILPITWKSDTWISDNTGPRPITNPIVTDSTSTKIMPQEQLTAIEDAIKTKAFQDLVKGTSWQDTNTMNKALEIFSIEEITKISKLKRHAQDARTKFLHKVSNAMVNHNWTDKVVMAGGCFTSWYHNEPLKDIDVFILDNTYIADALKEAVKLDEYRFKVGNSSYMPNSKIGYTAFDTSTRIQYIVSEYKTREELLDHFDLVHDCISFVENKLYITREAFDAMRTKTLKNNKGNKPADWRINKFLIDRGFRVG